MSFGGALLGSAQGEIVVNVEKALANISTLETKVQGLNNVGSGALAPLGQAGTQVQTLTQKADAFGAKYRTMGLVGAGAGAAIVGGFALSINSAANFEASMDGVGASLGGVGTASGITKEQMAALNDEALSIGADTAFSAGEAAGAMDELAKAGQNAETILGGSARASVDLASAIGVNIPDAASAVARAMNVWQNDGLTAAEAADTLTAAVNGAATDLPDLSAGLRNVGPIAANLGIPFNEAAAGVAYFTNFGLKGADAGVSMARALENLASPTSEASAKMAELGIDAFDAQGEFIGFPALMDQLNGSMAGMSDEAKQSALSMIFGAEAADVMGIGILEGGDALRQMEQDLISNGQAQEQAQQRMDNFKGSLEQLKGSIETAMIVFGSLLLPLLRPLVDGLTAFVNLLTELPKPLQIAAAAVLGIVGALAGIAGAMILIGPKVIAFGSEFASLAQKLTKLPQAIRAVSMALRGLLAANPWILAIIAIIALLYLAYKTNFLGFGDGVRKVAGWIGDAFKKIASIIKKFVDMWKDASDPGELKIVSFIEELGDAFDRIFGTDISGYFDIVADAIQKVADKVGDIVGWFKDLNAAAAALRSAGMDPLTAAFAALGSAFSRLETGIEPIDDLLQNLSDLFFSLADAAQAFLSGDFAGGFDALKQVAQDLLDVFLNLATMLPRLILELAQAIDWGALVSGAIGLGATLIGYLGDLGGALWTWITDAVGGIDWYGLWEDVKTVTGTIVTKLGNLAGAIKGWVTGAIGSVDWYGVWNTVKTVTGTIITKLGNLAGAIKGWVTGAVGGIDWYGVWNTVKKVTGTIVTKLGNLAAALLGWVTGAIADIDWYGVWNTVKKVTGTIIVKLGDLATAIKNWVTGAVEGVGWDTVFNVATAAFKVVSDAIKLIKTVGEEVAEFLKGDWLPAIPIPEWLKDLIAKLGEAGELLGTVKKAAFGGGDDGGGDVAPLLPPTFIGGRPPPPMFRTRQGENIPITSAADFLPKVGTGPGSTPPPPPDMSSWNKAIATAMAAFQNAIRSGMNTAAAFSISGVARIRTALTTLTGMASTAGTAAMKAFQTALQQGMNTTTANTISGVARIRTALTTLTGMASTAGTAAVAAFRTALQQGMNTTTANTISGVARIRDAMNTLTAMARTAGTAAGNSFRDGIQAGMNSAANAASNGASRIRSAMQIGSMYSAGYSVGSSLGQGIANGIASWTSSIANTAANAVNQAEAAARNAADARSPSRLFMALGEDMGEGLAIGLENSQAGVNDAFRDLIPSGTADTAWGGLPTPGAGAAAAQYVQIITLEPERWQEYLNQAALGAEFARTFPVEMTLARSS